MGSIKLSNEINKDIIKKLKESELDKNIEDFINDALKLEYSVLDEKILLSISSRDGNIVLAMYFSSTKAAFLF